MQPKYNVHLDLVKTAVLIIDLKEPHNITFKQNFKTLNDRDQFLIQRKEVSDPENYIAIIIDTYESGNIKITNANQTASMPKAQITESITCTNCKTTHQLSDYTKKQTITGETIYICPECGNVMVESNKSPL